MAEVINGPLQAFFQADARLPAQKTSSSRDIRPAALGIVNRQGMADHAAGTSSKPDDQCGDVSDAKFRGISQVDRQVNFLSIGRRGFNFCGVVKEQLENAVHKVTDVAKTTGLSSFPVNREVLAFESLNDEI